MLAIILGLHWCTPGDYHVYNWANYYLVYELGKVHTNACQHYRYGVFTPAKYHNNIWENQYLIFAEYGIGHANDASYYRYGDTLQEITVNTIGRITISYMKLDIIH